MMLLACLFLLWATAVQAQPPVEVKVVVVTMFERGADTGDQPGEFQVPGSSVKVSTACSRFPKAGAMSG